MRPPLILCIILGWFKIIDSLFASMVDNLCGIRDSHPGVKHSDNGCLSVYLIRFFAQYSLRIEDRLHPIY